MSTKTRPEYDEVLDQIYEQRKFAIDPECGSVVRKEAWIAIDGLLDVYNQITASLVVSEAEDLTIACGTGVILGE